MSASTSTALKRKRRVYKDGCANPLFVEWVEEWRDDARERGVNSHYSYTKVARYLILITIGSECYNFTYRHSPRSRNIHFLFLVARRQKFWIMSVCTDTQEPILID